jgi:hypothetical protein
MKSCWPSPSVVARWFAACVLLFALASAHGANTLDWRTAENRVSADIASWTLEQTLEQIAAVTGWHIFLEPGTKQNVSVKFANRAPDRALDLLLGDLGRVLLPPTNGVNSRLLVFRSKQDQATQLIQARLAAVSTNKTAVPIPNELVVTLKPGESIEELAKKLGAKVIGKIEGTDTYRLKFEDEESTKSARETLKNDPAVASVDNNYNMIPTPNAQSLGAGGMPINLRPKAVPDGDRIIVGLVDTAVQAKGSGIAEFLLPGMSVVGDAQTSDTAPTHGTSMAESVLRGAASAGEELSSRVRILNVDVYGNNANTTTFDVAAGITKAVNGGAMIINLSLGSEGSSSLLQQIIQDSHKQGVVFLASAGNEPVTTPTYPAAYPEVIAVTAGDGRGNLASYANRGNFVDVMGPGTVPVNYNGQLWRVTGTSPATAFISGLAAGYADIRKLSWSEIDKAIRNGPQISAPR